MALTYPQIRQLLEGRRLPAAFVDLDAFDANAAKVAAQVRDHGLPLRIATKSLRVTGLVRRLQEAHGEWFRGLMCYAVQEARHLAERGFDDLLVAYPVFRRADVEDAVALVEDGVDLKLMCDSRTGIERLAQVASAAGAVLPVVLCVDMSLELAGGRLHLGVRRSPLRTPAEVVELARAIQRRASLRFAGVMGYEAQVAGLGDDNPFEPLLNPVKSWIRQASVRELGARRAAIVDALARADLTPALVNGGGSGSLDTTTRDTGVTEVTAGSAFFKPHLFDYYRSPHMRALQPACFFALEVTRLPSPSTVTCLGGGYVASGPPGRDKVPLPWLPAGLELLAEEMCGEVQTPLKVPSNVRLELGDPVIFRHAKGGELAERFREVLLIEGGEVVGSEPTYRGEGVCFF